MFSVVGFPTRLRLSLYLPWTIDLAWTPFNFFVLKKTKPTKQKTNHALSSPMYLESVPKMVFKWRVILYSFLSFYIFAFIQFPEILWKSFWKKPHSYFFWARSRELHQNAWVQTHKVRHLLVHWYSCVLEVVFHCCRTVIAAIISKSSRYSVPWKIRLLLVYKVKNICWKR